MKDFLKNIINDLAVDLGDEFDQNFERKAFFDKKWPDTKWPNKKGTLMMRTGALRRSIKRPNQHSKGLIWSSSMPYASIHNQGGTIIVTAKMKKYFWAMYYQLSKAIKLTAKEKVSKSARNVKLSQQAQTYKALALQKIGSKMTIQKRQFIGDHPVVRQRIEHVVDSNIKELQNEIFKRLKR
jgi:phage gpG-like protein